MESNIINSFFAAILVRLWFYSEFQFLFIYLLPCALYYLSVRLSWHIGSLGVAHVLLLLLVVHCWCGLGEGNIHTVHCVYCWCFGLCASCVVGGYMTRWWKPHGLPILDMGSNGPNIIIFQFRYGYNRPSVIAFPFRYGLTRPNIISFQFGYGFNRPNIITYITIITFVCWV